MRGLLVHMGGYINNQAGDDNNPWIFMGVGHEVHNPSDGKFTILGVNVITYSSGFASYKYGFLPAKSIQIMIWVHWADGCWLLLGTLGQLILRPACCTLVPLILVGSNPQLDVNFQWLQLKRSSSHLIFVWYGWMNQMPEVQAGTPTCSYSKNSFKTSSCSVPIFMLLPNQTQRYAPDGSQISADFRRYPI